MAGVASDRTEGPIARDAKSFTFSDKSGPVLRATLGEFLDVIFPYALFFATIAIAVSLYRSWSYGWYHTMALHAAMYVSACVVVLLRHRIPSVLVVSFFLCVISLDCIQSMINMGLSGPGLVILTVVCIFAGMFIGLWTGILFVAGGIVAAIFIMVGLHAGVITPRPNIAEYLRTPVAWLLQVACFVLYTIPLIVTNHVLGQRMTKAARELKEMNVRLQEEVLMREQAEGDFRTSEYKYHNVLEHAAEGIFQSTVDGRIMSVNPAMARMMGYSSVDEMLSNINERGDTLCAYREDEDRLRRALEENGYVEDLEVRLNGRGSEGPWARLNIHRVYGRDGTPQYQGTAEDLTDARLAESALHESEAKYRTVVENSLVASCIVQDGFFRFVNTTFCAITGFSRRELVNRMMLSDIIHPEQKRAWQDGARRIAGDQAGRLELELKIVSKSNSVVTAKVLAGSTTYDDRMAIFGTFVDVTNEKSLEAQLRQAQKMEAIGTLAGGIAHDFNNILTALTGYATLLKTAVHDTEPLRHYADQILSASHKAASLTQSLLTFGRKQPPASRPVDINSIVEGTETLLRRLVTEDISFSTHLTTEDVVVMADATQIDQVLFNLVLNARDAMPEGGRLTIRTERILPDRDFAAAHGLAEAGEFALLSVSDTGIGMDEETKGRIFESFFTTKEPGKGTGLGLSTVDSIVKQHHGCICVSSEPSLGSTFFIYLPIVKRIGEEIGSFDTGFVEDRAASETILVADDNPELRMFVRDILQACGYRVIEAADGDDALAKFFTHDHISLVVLDLVMPKRNGARTYDAMTEARPNTKVLFVSGHTTDTILEKGINESEVDFMRKPLDPNLFVEKVKEMIGR